MEGQTKEAELAALKKSRGYVKATVTRAKRFIEEKLALLGSEASCEINVSEIKLRRDRLIAAFEDYSRLCLQIQILDEKDSEDLGKFEDVYFQVVAHMDDLIDKSSANNNKLPPTSDSIGENKAFHNIKLPHITIPTFSGRYSDFYAFFNMFDSVVGSTDKPPVQKLYYLKTFLSGEALALVQNLPLADESYVEAVNLLKQRYENKFQIVNEHITMLLDQQSIAKSVPTALRTFVSTCHQHMAALKNLGEPVTQWDSILLHLLAKKLDIFSSRAYQLERDQAVKPNMNDFLSFLERRALALENTDSMSVSKPQVQRYAVNVVSTSNATSKEIPSCIYCKSNHKIFQCPSFKLAPLEKRFQFATQHKLCEICLTTHPNKKCRFHFKCSVCKKPHNTLLHKDEAIPTALPTVTLMSGASHGQVLLPTAWVRLYSNTGTAINCRALLDSGSQACFATQKLVNHLGGTAKRTNSNIIGITNAEQTITHSINVEVHSQVYPFKANVKCHVVPQITSRLPQRTFDISHIKLPEASQLADPNFNKPGDVHLLLGADILFQALLPQPAATEESGGDAAASSHPDQPSLLHTSFGYIIAGQIATSSASNKVVSLFCRTCESDISESISKFWKADQVHEIYPEKLPEVEYTENHFKDNVELNDNKFQVTIPLKVPMVDMNHELGDSFHLALSRFLNLENRFSKAPKLFEGYKKFIDEYVSLGHAKYINLNQYDLSKDPVYFLPHHPVIKEDNKTTKLRVVFDGSAKTKNKISLNDMMMNGPVVQRDLFDVLIAFRLGKHFFISDIKMMFRFIALNPLQRSLQNILWRDQPNEDIKCIQLQTVTYGLKTSSYLATRCLIELAQRFKTQLPSATSILENNTYVDDILATHDNEKELVSLQKDLVHLLSLGGFQLHKWSSNSAKVLSNIPKEKQYFGEVDLDKDDLSVKTLGVNFDMRTDTFKLSTSQPCSGAQSTKRQILSYISKFFDPLGLMGPIFVQAKIIMQLLWAESIGWDETPPDHIREKWIEFAKSLSEMEPLYIPRCIKSSNKATIQLVGFADASLTAHGCCLYLRVVDSNDEVSMNLICSKSRINSHKNKLTIPRLELNAALLLARLTHKVLESLHNKALNVQTHMFVDSQIVLAWLNTDIAKLNTYAANRVRVINDYSLKNSLSWGYVTTIDNPADCISRGLLPHELKDHTLWWHGPSLLHDNKVTIHKAYGEPSLSSDLQPESNDDTLVPVACAASASDHKNCVLQPIIEKFSSITKMTRVLAYVLRYLNNLKPNSVKCQENFLSVNELDSALALLIKSEQEKYFSKEIKCIQANDQYNGNLKSLHPFIGQDKLLHVGGRLHHASLPFSKKHPIILPKDSVVTELIIRREHIRLLHAGQRLVLSSINQKYWLTDGLRCVKKFIHKCIICFRLKAEASSQLMGSLPADRVNACRPFEKVGMDFAGPISVKQSRIRKPVIGKGYILVIVCFVTKAIHLELASDLTTDTFLAAFKRFAARRNLPSAVYCDNASTFKGAKARLDDLYRLHGGDKAHQIQVQTFAAEKGIKFHFIPSYSPIYGGLWERSVKSVKHHLKRAMAGALLTYEQINTILTEIEAVLNSRPISAMSTDPSDFSCLTPGHFLTGAPMNSYPEKDVSDTPTNRLKFWAICINMKQLFWKHWKDDYLTTLQNRPKWHNVLPNITVGTLVILREQNIPPLQWPMARVTKIFPGTKDGVVRAIEVMTSNGHSHRRSITKVCVLPIDTN